MKRTQDPGFTVVELLIGVMMTGIILSVLTSSFFVFFGNSSSIAGRDDHTAGAEFLAVYLDRDVASATDPPVIPAGSGCTTVRTLVSLSWNEQTKGGLADSPPLPGTGGNTYKATYEVMPDPARPGRCAIQRKYYNPATTLVLTNVLIGNLAAADVKPTASGACGTSDGQPVRRFTLTLIRYLSEGASGDYTYRGCLNARTNGLN